MERASVWVSELACVHQLRIPAQQGTHYIQLPTTHRLEELSPLLERIHLGGTLRRHFCLLLLRLHHHPSRREVAEDDQHTGMDENDCCAVSLC
jgi:hypothetical protein